MANTVRLIRYLPSDPQHGNHEHKVGELAEILKDYQDAANRHITLVRFYDGEQRIVLDRDIEKGGIENEDLQTDG